MSSLWSPQFGDGPGKRQNWRQSRSEAEVPTSSDSDSTARDRVLRKDRAAGPCTLWSASVRHVRALRVRPAGESLPRDEPLRVGNGLDPLADLLR